MRVIFGGDYADAAPLLRIITLGLPGYLLLGLCWYGLVAFGQERLLFRIGLAGLSVTTAFAVAVIPSGGDDGAAWAYVAAIYAMALASFAAVERTSLRPPADPPGTTTGRASPVLEAPAA